MALDDKLSERIITSLLLLSATGLQLVAVPVGVSAAEPGESIVLLAAEPERPPIQQIIIEGSTAFTPNELQQAVAPFLGQPASLATLQELARVLAEYYWQAGYKTSDAYPLAGQDLSQGIARLQVVEGRLAGIEVEGLQSVGDSYVKEWLLDRAGGVPLNVDRLLEAVKLLQLDPRFEAVKAELLQGDSPQYSLLKVSVVEAPNFSGQVGGNNEGAYSSGQEQGEVQLTVGSLTGRADRLNLEAVASEGSYQVWADYQIPINPKRGRLRFYYSGGESAVIREPLARFNIEGNYQKAWLEWRQPLVKTLNREVAVAVEAGWQQSQTFVLGRPFSFSPQIPDEGYEIWTLRFSGEWLSSEPSRALAARVQVTVGIDSLSATDDPFLIGRGQFQWLEKLDDSLLFSLSLSAQVTAGELAGAGFGVLPSEQFPIGGLPTVPGYDLNLRRGDSGVNVILKLQQTALDTPDWGQMSLEPFVAVGTVWNETIYLPPPQTLASLGLNWQWHWQSWQVNLGVAVPLSDVPNTFKQEFYFSIRTHFSF
jgi:hemolysin activation/secretion protein